MKELRNILIIIFAIASFASFNKIDTIINNIQSMKISIDTNYIIGALVLGALVWIVRSRKKKVVYVEVEKGKGDER